MASLCFLCSSLQSTAKGLYCSTQRDIERVETSLSGEEGKIYSGDNFEIIQLCLKKTGFLRISEVLATQQMSYKLDYKIEMEFEMENRNGISK